MEKMIRHAQDEVRWVRGRNTGSGMRLTEWIQQLSPDMMWCVLKGTVCSLWLCWCW